MCLWRHCYFTVTGNLSPSVMWFVGSYIYGSLTMGTEQTAIITNNIWTINHIATVIVAPPTNQIHDSLGHVQGLVTVYESVHNTCF